MMFKHCWGGVRKANKIAYNYISGISIDFLKLIQGNVLDKLIWEHQILNKKSESSHSKL